MYKFLPWNSLLQLQIPPAISYHTYVHMCKYIYIYKYHDDRILLISEWFPDFLFLLSPEDWFLNLQQVKLVLLQ